MKGYFLFLTGIFILVSLSGCETVKGIGKDIQNTSSSVQRSLSR